MLYMMGIVLIFCPIITLTISCHGNLERKTIGKIIKTAIASSNIQFIYKYNTI